jgi:hypothetical protein
MKQEIENKICRARDGLNRHQQSKKQISTGFRNFPAKVGQKRKASRRQSRWFSRDDCRECQGGPIGPQSGLIRKKDLMTTPHLRCGRPLSLEPRKARNEGRSLGIRCNLCSRENPGLRIFKMADASSASSVVPAMFGHLAPDG